MAWKKPFFKRVSSKISDRMLNLIQATGITRPVNKGETNGERAHRLYRFTCSLFHLFTPPCRNCGCYDDYSDLH
jgi:hypothetical protein